MKEKKTTPASAEASTVTVPAPVRAPSQPSLYDVDDVNPTFARFYPVAEQLLLTSEGLEPLFNWFELPGSTAVADFGARAVRSLSDFEHNNGFYNTARAYNTRLVVAFALAPEEDSIGLLKRLSASIGNRVTWLIVRSTFKHGTWDLWEGSKTRKEMEALEATEMEAPTLTAPAFSELGKFSLKATDAVNDARLSLVRRSAISTWRNYYIDELERAVVPLLNEEGKTMFLVTGDKGGVGKSSFARALTDWFLNPAKSNITPKV
jgi:hypothetical protein